MNGMEEERLEWKHVHLASASGFGRRVCVHARAGGDIYRAVVQHNVQSWRCQECLGRITRTTEQLQRHRGTLSGARSEGLRGGEIFFLCGRTPRPLGGAGRGLPEKRACFLAETASP